MDKIKPQPQIAIGVATARNALHFINAFKDAPAGTDLEFHLARFGNPDTGPLILTVSIGPRLFAFTKSEANRMAQAIEEMIQEIGNHGSLADLVLGLRYGASKLDQPLTQG